jgi:hypothetical protein
MSTKPYVTWFTLGSIFSATTLARKIPDFADDCEADSDAASNGIVDAPFQARENVGIVVAVVGCYHLSGL